MKTREERFWEKVEKKGVDDCWPWLGATIGKTGRGCIWKFPRLRVAAQISWEFHNKKDFPEGMFACHSCDNPRCVNPAHIWAGTRSENTVDALNKGLGFIPTSPHAGKTHCKYGHEFTASNTRLRLSDKSRQCVACIQARNKKRGLRQAVGALLFCVAVSACSSIASPVVPALENRSLRISTKVPGFEYSWMVCTKSFLGACRKWEQKTEYYDLTNSEIRDRLIDMGFVGRVREKILP